MGIYHFSVNTVLATAHIVERASGEVIETLRDQSEKMILALRAEYPDCEVIVETNDNSRVLARCRDFPNSPSLAMNYKDFGEKVVQHSTFLLEADHLETVKTETKDGNEYEEIIPFSSNDKEWEDVLITEVELPNSLLKENRSRLGKNSRRARLG